MHVSPLILGLLPAGFLSMWCVGALHAQDAALGRRDAGVPGAVEAGLVASRRAISEEADSGPAASVDADLYGAQEILARPDRWQPWTLGASLNVEYQENAALAPQREEGDFVFRQTSSARHTMKLSDAWYLDFGGAQQAVRYDAIEALDFDRLDADVAALWISPPTWHVALADWIVSTRVSWYRLSEAERWNTGLFSNTALAGGLLRSFPVHRHHSLLTSLSGEVSVQATSDQARRNEYAAFIAWQAQWSPRWESSLLVRSAFYDYDDHDDWNFIGSLSVDWVLNPNWRCGLSASWTLNESDASVFRYDNGTLGASLRFQIRF